MFDINRERTTQRFGLSGINFNEIVGRIRSLDGLYTSTIQKVEFLVGKKSLLLQPRLQLENGVFIGLWKGSWFLLLFGICITLALHFYWAVDVYGEKKRWNLPSHSFSFPVDSLALLLQLLHPYSIFDCCSSISNSPQMRIKNNLI